MPNMLLPGQEPYEPSGWFMEEPQAIEITLCGEPAVRGALFRVIQNADTKHTLKLQMPVRKKNKVKQQVMGYVSIPWLEDFYGDVMDPSAVEHAANSFMHNLQMGLVTGGGVGEEHVAFWNNAHVIQSCIDYTGGIGGIPGGWWIAIQVTDPDTWQKVTDGTYSGFSLGSAVHFVNTQSEDFKSKLYARIPDLRSYSATKPSKGKVGAFANPGEYGFPVDQAAYADPTNNKFPIDTRSRAYATLRYVLENYDSEGYGIDELKYVVRRMLAAIVSHGDAVPPDVMGRAGFSTKQSILDFIQNSGLKTQATHTSVEEDNNMSGTLSPEILEAIQASTQDSVNAATQDIKNQLASIQALLTGAKVQTEDSDKTPKNSEDTADEGQKDTAKKDDAQKDDSKADDAKQSVLSADDVRSIVQGMLGEIQSKDQAASDKPLTVETFQAVLGEFGKSLATSLVESQKGTVDAVQAAAQRISELPMPRATALRTMTNNDKSNFMASVKQKVESGADLSLEDMQRAEQLGADFSLADPFARLSV